MDQDGAMAQPRAPVASRPYEGETGRAYHDGKRRLEPGALELLQRLRAAKFQPWVGEADVVFELGVGGGWNLAKLRCARRIGCDEAGFLRERVEALGIEFHTGTDAVESGVADVALCHHTLEHLLEPAAALAELARILKPRGRLVLHVPWEREWKHGRFRPDEPNRHLYTWNAQTLGNLAARLGWRIESLRVRRYGYDRAVANLAAKWKAGYRGFLTMRRLVQLAMPLREVELVAGAPAEPGEGVGGG